LCRGKSIKQKWKFLMKPGLNEHKKNSMSRILICLILLLPSFLPAQTVLTLEEAVQKALEKNYDIRLTQNDLQTYALDQEYANAAFLPRLNGTASRVWNSNSQRQTFTDGTERERDDIRSTNLASAINL